MGPGSIALIATTSLGERRNWLSTHEHAVRPGQHADAPARPSS